MQLRKISVEELTQKGKNIICFGSEKAFDKFFELFENFKLIDRIKYIVDNDKSKHGKPKRYDGFDIPIVAPDFFIGDSHDLHTICIITLKDKDAILNQYESIDSLRYITVVWHMDFMREYCTRMLNKAKPVKNVRRSETMMIPKRIHYCWFGGNRIPEKNRKWMESWRKFCPDYEIIQWDETNYDVGKNRYMRDAYEMRQYAFASDYARLDILYQEGGIYLDTDVELIKSMDELLYQPAFFGWEDGLRVATGLGFGAVRHFDLLKELRDDYDNRSFFREDGKCDMTACPSFQTRVLQRYGLKKDGNYQIIRTAAILPVTFLCGKPSYVTTETRSECTYAIHQFQGSGRGKDK